LTRLHRRQRGNEAAVAALAGRQAEAEARVVCAMKWDATGRERSGRGSSAPPVGDLTATVQTAMRGKDLRGVLRYRRSFLAMSPVLALVLVGVSLGASNFAAVR
jgi:hypothetical protein